LFSTGVPALGQTTEIVDQKQTPVVLIHGVGAALIRRLKENGKPFINDGFPNDLAKGAIGDPEKLQFDSSGKPRTDTFSKDMVAYGFFNVPLQEDITNLSKHLGKQKEYDLSTSLFEFAYDFRFSVLDAAKKLGELIEKIKLEQNVKQVDIVGHSMGGLVAKAYLLKSENGLNVRKMIFVASPHLGAPKALKVLRYGDNLDAPIFNECKLKRVGRNMPGLYNLFPGKKYFELQKGFFYDDDDLDGDSEKGLLNFEQTILNMKKGKETRCPLDPNIDVASYDKDMPLLHLNNGLIDRDVIAFHALLDKWVKPEGLQVFNVIGYGQPTIESIRERGSIITLNQTTEGDGTVPLWSAEAVESDHTYYVYLPKLKANHSKMVGDMVLKKQIHRLLRDGDGIYVNNVYAERPKEFQLSSVIMK
jgi:pimeloyl-ACP methyl ester carboxylesterase